MTPAIRFDTSNFSRALAQFRKLSQRDFETVLREQARGVVRNIIAFTPPARGKADSGARKLGEKAVTASLARILKPGTPDFIAFFERVNGGPTARNRTLGLIYSRVLEKGDLDSFHQGHRDNEGRTPKGAGNIALVERRAYQWFKKQVQARVGKLASGWNKAAARLGYSPPAWIRRHGNGRGDCELQLTGDDMRILISNEVKFAGSVKDIERSVKKAIAIQTRSMERRVAFATEKAAKRAGFRSR
jgi:hypothetical protein